MLFNENKPFSLLHRARNEDFEFSSPNQDMHREELHITSGGARDPSPELVRISPLVTRPPKIKPSSEYFFFNNFLLFS